MLLTVTPHRPRVERPIIVAARAAALFASTLEPSDKPRADRIRLTVQDVLRDKHLRGCRAFVAFEFGAHPETAVPRMAWALAAVRAAFTGYGPQ